MNRRDFIHAVGIATASTSLDWNHAASLVGERPVTTDLDIWVEENDKRIGEILESQQTDKGQPFFGGFANRFGLYPAGRAAWNAARLVCGLVADRSKYFENETAMESLQRAVEFLIRSQHADGTIDLLTTNFHSTPDTGFVVEPVALAYTSAQARAPQALEPFLDRAGEFLVRAGKALSKGGIHTPNHRWVVCMALARIHQHFPDPKLVERIDQWLAEQIDIDPDGQYTERSTSVYSPLVDRCLITVARLLGREELLAPVRKNLLMTRYFARANGEVATEVSRRQDQYAVRKMGRYYYSYYYMAVRENDQQFSAMADFIRRTVGPRDLTRMLPYVIEDSRLTEPLPERGQVPTNFVKSFPHSGIIRIRRNHIDASIVNRNPVPFTFHKKSVAIRALRFASAFFGKGQFVAESMKTGDDGYQLRQSLKGPYYQPLPKEKLPGDGNWSKMPRDLRRQSEVQHLDSTLSIREQEGIFYLHIQVTGTEKVPVAIEFYLGDRQVVLASEERNVAEAERSQATSEPSKQGGLRSEASAEGKLRLYGCRRSPHGEGAYLAAERVFGFQSGRERIEVEWAGEAHQGKKWKSGDKVCQHEWTQLRGAEEKPEGASVYLTDYTPLDLKLIIR